MRVLLDSNVWLAHLTQKGVCRKVIEAAASRCVFVTSPYICAEVREKLVSKFRCSDAVAAALVEELKAESQFSEASAAVTAKLRDPDDLPILAAAVASQCQFLVTGDKDLLKLKSFAGVEIVSVREFAERLGFHPEP